MDLHASLDALVAAARDGDTGALQRLFEFALDDLRGRVERVLGPRPRRGLYVDDLMEEALLHALRSLPSLRASDYRGFRAWFRAIARNRWLASARDARVRELPDCGLEPERLSAEDLARANARNAPQRRVLELYLRLGRLPCAQRVAFVLRDGLGLPWATIAFVLARRPPSAARLVHFRARARLTQVVPVG